MESMELSILTPLIVLGLAAVLLMAAVQLRHLRQAPGGIPSSFPSPGVLKPLKGADPGLEENLASFFRQTYPRYQIVLGVAEENDPAVAVARHVMADHPHVPARLVVGGSAGVLNPKVGNLANIVRHAGGELILISDSNVRVSPGYLEELVAQLERPGVHLVSSPFRGIGRGSVGTACEALHLNTFVMGGVAAVHHLLRGVCVVGKSMLLHRADLEAMGGFAFLGRFLAEDQVCGQEVAAAGGRLVLSSHVVDNVVGGVSVRRFLSRHLRWAKIRWRMSRVGYLAELLLNPVFVATVQLAVVRTAAAAGALAAALLVKSAVDAAVERRLGVRRLLVLYPFLVFFKDLCVGLTWPVPLISRTVTWRGNRLRIGRRTELCPVAGPAGELEVFPVSPVAGRLDGGPAAMGA